MINQGNIAYYIDFSIHEIPSVAFIAYETGGTVYTDSEQTFEFLRKDHPALNSRYFASIAEIKADMRSSGVRVILYPDYHIRYFKDTPGVKHVQIFHGLSDKKYDFRRDVLEYDAFFIAGETAYRRYEKKGLLKTGKGILVGYPKFDRVFRNEMKRDDALKKIGLDPRKKTILYAPTWVDKEYNSSWKKFRTAFLNDIPPDVNLIVKLHPNMKRYYQDEVMRFGERLLSFQNTLLLDFIPDIVPVMAASDLLVSDVSAVTREFLALKRPFVFLSCKPKWMWRRSKIQLWECGEVVTRPANVWLAIKRALKYPERYLDLIEGHFGRTFYKPDGKAAQRAAEIIDRMLHDTA